MSELIKCKTCECDQFNVFADATIQCVKCGARRALVIEEKKEVKPDNG